ncbi:unnamed protein product [Gongylonema pulchrum]|uniref:Nuclear pore complex protein Nup98-Nup96 n=1 Tax=Gongylonema pulchrum TaxID=637853 RepID=A0A183E864_9BILA|nr:unnamed protein product [Gongylonema pulchrum]
MGDAWCPLQGLLLGREGPSSLVLLQFILPFSVSDVSSRFAVHFELEFFSVLTLEDIALSLKRCSGNRRLAPPIRLLLEEFFSVLTLEDIAHPLKRCSENRRLAPPIRLLLEAVRCLVRLRIDQQPVSGRKQRRKAQACLDKNHFSALLAKQHHFSEVLSQHPRHQRHFLASQSRCSAHRPPHSHPVSAPAARHCLEPLKPHSPLAAFLDPALEHLNGISLASSVTGTTVKFEPPSGTDTMIRNGTNQTISTKHMCISAMKQYESKSLEELRCEDYLANRKGPQSGGITFGQTSQPSTSLFGTSATTTQSSLFGQNKPLFGSCKFAISLIFKFSLMIL